MRLRNSMLLFAAFTLSGCANRLHPMPDLAVAAPSEWSTGSSFSSSSAAPTRNALDDLVGDDAQLRMLLTKAWTSNFDIRRAVNRWQQAGLTLRDSGVAHWPTLSVSATAGVSKTLSSPVTEVNFNGVPIQVSASNALNKSFGIAFSTSYEADLWGRLTEVRKAAAATEQSALVDLDAARRLALAQVAEKYWRVAAIDEKTSVARERIVNAAALLAIEQAKRDAGLVRATDVLRSDEALQNARKRVVEFTADRERYVREIAILLDAPPHTFTIASARLPQTLPSVKTLDTPLAVIERRPDVLAARLTTARALTQLNIAEIDRLPSISLPMPSLSSGSPTLQDLFRTPALSISTGLTAPILDWGKRLRARDRERLTLDAAVLSYSERVYSAIVEVYVALAALERSEQQFAQNSLREQRVAREYVARQTEYDVGKIERARLIEARETLSDARTDAIDTRLALWLARIELLKALAEPLSFAGAK